MAAKDLITSTRAKDALGGASSNTANLTLSSDEQTTLADLITSCSDAVAKYCRRDFLSKSYDELYSGSGDRRLLLREYPVQSVQSVRYRYQQVMTVQNMDTSTNQQARVSITSTGLTLKRVASGVASTASVTFASNVTIDALVSAINALGNGWTAQRVGDATDYGKWPSADLYVPPAYGDGVQSGGALNARGVAAPLRLHTAEFQGFEWDARGWLLRSYPYTEPEAMQGSDFYIWPVGTNNFRVQYTAGYTTVPEAVQEACAEWVALLFWATKRDPALAHQVPNAGTAQGWMPLHTGGKRPPGRVAALLAPYRRHTIATNQG